MHEKYETWRKEGKLSMQQLAKELIEKGILPADLDYKSDDAIKLAIKYDEARTKEKFEAIKEERRIREEKRKALPPLETWIGKNIPMEELHKMGYSYLEMMELASRL